VETIVETVERAACWDLVTGDLEEAARFVTEAVEGATRRDLPITDAPDRAVASSVDTTAPDLSIATLAQYAGRLHR
jgi:hypothetical protein